MLDQNFHASDLSYEELIKLKSYRKYADECVVCRHCKEWSNLLESCCDPDQGDYAWDEIANEYEASLEPSPGIDLPTITP